MHEYHPDLPQERPTMSHRALAGPRKQSDGRKPIPHIITAIVSVVLTFAAAHFTSVFQGPAGRPGTTTVISKVAQDYGFCQHFGWDAQTGRYQLQITAAVADKAGAYCPDGTFTSVDPYDPHK